MWSAGRGDVAAMKLLLMHGASLHVQDKYGKYYLYMLGYLFFQKSCTFSHNKCKVELDMFYESNSNKLSYNHTQLLEKILAAPPT